MGESSEIAFSTANDIAFPSTKPNPYSAEYKLYGTPVFLIDTIVIKPYDRTNYNYFYIPIDKTNNCVYLYSQL